MTRGEAIKQFLWKSIVPAATAMLLVCICKSACMKGGRIDYMWLWILCGLPFGLHRMCLWIVPSSRSFGGGIPMEGMPIPDAITDTFTPL